MTAGFLLHVAFWLAVFILFYAVISRGMFRAAEPLRYEMLDIAGELLNSENVSEAQKWRINLALSEIHSGRAAWKMIFWAICLIVMIPIHRFKLPNTERGIPNHLKGSFQKFQIRWLIATISNSPAAAFIFVLLTLLVSAFDLSIRKLSAVLMTKHDRHDGSDVVRA